jgi:hypothetical protein
VAGSLFLLGGLPLPEAALTKTELTARYMASRPEADLQFPFSRIIDRESHGEGKYDAMIGGHPPGNAPASAFVVLDVPLPPTDSTASTIWWWYRQELTIRGWHLVASDNKSAGDSAQVYARGNRELLVIGFDGTTLPYSIKYDGHGAVYSLYYQVGSCTDPASNC